MVLFQRAFVHYLLQGLQSGGVNNHTTDYYSCTMSQRIWMWGWSYALPEYCHNITCFFGTAMPTSLFILYLYK